MITINHYPYFLEFMTPFGTAHGMRTGTPCVLVELTENGHTGFGEASLPPYLEDRAEDVRDFISMIDLQSFSLPQDLDSVLDYIMQAAPGNYPAKAALDMAVHDLKGKVDRQPSHQLFGLHADRCPVTTYTIGLGNEAGLAGAVAAAAAFPLLKIKAGGTDDRQRISRISSLSEKPFCVDANQGWADKELALEMLHYVKDLGAVFVEQPLQKQNAADAAWLKQHSPLPLIADESFQTGADLERINESFHGINIKLMKCGGMRPAYDIMKRARAFGLKILLGCMSESSCGVSAAAQLSPLADWADLDGPLLIRNDPFDGITYEAGRIVLNDRPGNGVSLKRL